LGLETDTAEIRRAEDISPAFDAFKSKVQALYVCGDALLNSNNVRINTLALGARLPTMYPTRSLVTACRPQVGCPVQYPRRPAPYFPSNNALPRT
jgi:putative tryptophan/tyrosine transport system substrate-binding protein